MEPTRGIPIPRPGDEENPRLARIKALQGLAMHWILYQQAHHTLDEVLPMLSSRIVAPGTPGRSLYAESMGRAVAENPPFAIIVSEDGSIWLRVDDGSGERLLLWSALQLQVLAATMPDRQ